VEGAVVELLLGEGVELLSGSQLQPPGPTFLRVPIQPCEDLGPLQLFELLHLVGLVYESHIDFFSLQSDGLDLVFVGREVLADGSEALVLLDLRQEGVADLALVLTESAVHDVYGGRHQLVLNLSYFIVVEALHGVRVDGLVGYEVVLHLLFLVFPWPYLAPADRCILLRRSL